jgi:hypothetical protein
LSREVIASRFVDVSWNRRRQQRELWIAGRARAEKISLGKGWQVRLRLKPWRSKVPVPWSAPIVGRRPATAQETATARALTPGWPDENEPGLDEAFVLQFADGKTWVVPQGVPLVLQRLRTPQREQEAKEWRFH